MKVAILGAGGIAKMMAKTLQGMVTEGIEMYAVGARELGRAEAFAKEWGFKKAYGSYEELVSDPEISLVYVATPHSHHYEQAKLCLEHGKNVLCEKSFTVNAKQAKELIALAREKNLLIAEAIWTRYMPSKYLVLEAMESGIIGKISSLNVTLGYASSDVLRIKEPSLAGGALLDIGVYTVHFAHMFFGSEGIKNIMSIAVLTEKGVDEKNSVIITYEDGRMAVLHSNTTGKTDQRGLIYGDKGYIAMENINNCDRIRIYDVDGKFVKELEVPEQITGFEYQVRACKRAIEAGKVECEEVPHDAIMKVMETMDGLRAEWGLKYPFE